MQRPEFLLLIRKSIDFYIIYSSFFEYVDKKIVFLNTNSKMQLINDKSSY